MSKQKSMIYITTNKLDQRNQLRKKEDFKLIMATTLEFSKEKWELIIISLQDQRLKKNGFSQR